MSGQVTERLLVGSIGTGVEELVRRARQMGITWRLLPARCTEATAQVATRVVVDGDTGGVPIPATSLIGAIPPQARVMVLLTGEGGIYVIGWYGEPQRPIIERIKTAEETADSPGFTAETVVMSVTARLEAGWTCWITADVGWGSSASGDRIIARLVEDDINGTRLKQGNIDIAVSSGVPWPWYGAVRYRAQATGTKTFVLTGAQASGGGTCRLEASPSAPSYLHIDRVGG